jgi:hypothetical protein
VVRRDGEADVGRGARGLFWRMQIALYPPMPTRPCRFCLSLQGDSVFADFEVDPDGRVFAVREKTNHLGILHQAALHMSGVPVRPVAPADLASRGSHAAADAAFIGYTGFMVPLRARVKNGRLVLDEPTALPEGTEVELALPDELDDDERARLHAALDATTSGPMAARESRRWRARP